MPPVVAEFLEHIIDELNYLRRNAQKTTKERFLEDETLQRSFVRSIEIIGEAVKQIPEPTRQRSSRIPWRDMSGMRDRLIHSYFGVDYEIVWDVAANKADQLLPEFIRVLSAERE
ncbi:MAG TPA: DUF86 domain-containing protein [Pyrinomonadaceae bacterium]|nr:DUF86 domain-containing protein [Pyrinomonadaceae bacterium]